MLTQAKILIWVPYNFEKNAKNGVLECRRRVFEVP